MTPPHPWQRWHGSTGRHSSHSQALQLEPLPASIFTAIFRSLLTHYPSVDKKLNDTERKISCTGLPLSSRSLPFIQMNTIRRGKVDKKHINSQGMKPQTHLNDTATRKGDVSRLEVLSGWLQHSIYGTSAILVLRPPAATKNKNRRIPSYF